MTVSCSIVGAARELSRRRLHNTARVQRPHLLYLFILYEQWSIHGTRSMPGLTHLLFSFILFQQHLLFKCHKTSLLHMLTVWRTTAIQKSNASGLVTSMSKLVVGLVASRHLLLETSNIVVVVCPALLAGAKIMKNVSYLNV